MPKADWGGLDSLPEESFVDPHAFDDDETSQTQPNQPIAGGLSPVGIAMPVAMPLKGALVAPVDSVQADDTEPVPLNVGPVTITPVFGHAGDSMGVIESPILSAEQLAQRDSLEAREKAESRQREVLVLERGFEVARAAAARWALGIEKGGTLDDILEVTIEAVIDAHIELETTYGISVELIRGKMTDALAEAYFQSLDKVGRDSLGFRTAFQSYVGLRARLGALLRVQSRLASLSSEGAPNTVSEEKMELLEARVALGVFDDARRDDIEKAYALRLQSLDLHDGADALVMKRLMRGRETLLEHIEQQEKGEQAAQEVADRAQPLEIADVQNVPPQHRTDRWYIDALRAPGRIIRSLFFGGAVALGAGAGVAALHEFAEVATDRPADDYSSRVISGPFDGTAGALSALAPEPQAPMKLEAPQEEFRLVPDGSAVWNEAGKMLRERGLKSTPALTSYFSHLLEVTNAQAIEAAGGVHHLPKNFPLVVTEVAAEMDAMAGIAPKVSGEGAIVKKQTTERSSAGVAKSSVERASAASGSRVVPTVDSPMHVMPKGEYLGKVTHSMLRASGLNWTTARINQLNAMVWEQNLPVFEQLVKEGKMRKLKPEYIPIGVELDFSSAARQVQVWADAKKPSQKRK
jgi:hypothetical protein